MAQPLRRPIRIGKKWMKSSGGGQILVLENGRTIALIFKSLREAATDAGVTLRVRWKKRANGYGAKRIFVLDMDALMLGRNVYDLRTSHPKRARHI